MSSAVEYVDVVRDRLDAVLAETHAAGEALEGIEARLDATMVVVQKQGRLLRGFAAGAVGLYITLNTFSPRIPGPMAYLDLNDMRLFERVHQLHLLVLHLL